MKLKKIFLVVALFMLSLHASEDKDISLVYYIGHRRFTMHGYRESDLNFENLSMQKLGRNCFVATLKDKGKDFLKHGFSTGKITEALITNAFYADKSEEDAVSQIIKDWNPSKTP